MKRPGDKDLGELEPMIDYLVDIVVARILAEEAKSGPASDPGCSAGNVLPRSRQTPRPDSSPT